MTTDKPRPVPVSELAAKEHLYGCHIDLAPDEVPDGCVIDEDRRRDCTEAHRHATKWTCPWWRLRSDVERI